MATAACEGATAPSGEEELVEIPDTGPRPDSGVLAELSRAFAGQLPRGVVADEVGRAPRELRGQVPSGSLPELLHQLAAHRLGRLAARR